MFYKSSLIIGLSVALIAAWACPAQAQITGTQDMTSAVQANLQDQRQFGSQTSRATAQTQRSEAPTTEKKKTTVRALLVGASNYSGAFLHLDGPANDANLFKEWLESLPKDDFDVKEIEVILDANSDKKKRPTRDNIAEAVQEACKAECDVLLFLFCGHGVGFEERSCLVPVDTEFQNFSNFPREKYDDKSAEEKRIAFNEYANENRLISVRGLVDQLKKAKAKNVVVLLDACRNYNESESATGNFMSENSNGFNIKSDENKNFCLVTACSLKETSKEYEGGGNDPCEVPQGRFSYHFVEGLKGAADRAQCLNGSITLFEAYNYAYSQLTKENDPQIPEIFMSNEKAGQIVLATAPLPTLDDLKKSNADPENVRETLNFLEEVGRRFLSYKTFQKAGESNFKYVDERTIANHKTSKGAANPKATYFRNNAEKLKINKTGLSVDELAEIKAPVQIGIDALTAVIDNTSSNVVARQIRGQAYRQLREYQKALDDFNAAGLKLQISAGLNQLRTSQSQAQEKEREEVQIYSTLDETVDGGQLAGDEHKINSSDLLTIDRVRTLVKSTGDDNDAQTKTYLHVCEINNGSGFILKNDWDDATKKKEDKKNELAGSNLDYWIDAESVGWDGALAESYPVAGKFNNRIGWASHAASLAPAAASSQGGRTSLTSPNPSPVTRL